MNSSLSIDNKYIYKYLTNSPLPKGVVHICHGMAEHIKRYKWLIDKLRKHKTNNDFFDSMKKSK